MLDNTDLLFFLLSSNKGYVNLSKQPNLMQFSNLLNPVKVKEMAKLWVNEDLPRHVFSFYC